MKRTIEDERHRHHRADRLAIFPKARTRDPAEHWKIRTTRKVRIALKTFVVTPVPRSEVSMANMSTEAVEEVEAVGGVLARPARRP